MIPIVNYFWEDTTKWRTLWIGAAGILVFIPVSYILRYRKAIKKRLEEIENRPLMVRVPYKDTIDKKEIRILELNPEFVRKHKGEWNLISLGQYMRSLRPFSTGNSDEDSKLPKFIEVELEAAIGSVLLRALGRRVGGTVLPLLGISNIHAKTARVAASIASWFVSRDLASQYKEDAEKASSVEHIEDKGTLPFGVNDLSAFANLNEELASAPEVVRSLDDMSIGEVGYKPSFGGPLPTGDEEVTQANTKNGNGTTKEDGSDLIPNPFIVSVHWESAIKGMEQLLIENESVHVRESHDSEAVKSTAGYDPDDRSFPEPTPISERLLPDLYMGWGSAKCSHTKREIIRNRLFCVLFNKLSYNFYKKEQKQPDLFVVKMTPETDEAMWTPQDFLQALLDGGHQIEMCPRTNITSFGLALCVKEKDGSFSNVPLGIFLRSGYEESDSRPVYYILPHGGMDLRISGPLVGKDATGKDRNCNIQFFVSVEGMTGWHSDHNAEVPWLKKISSTDVYTTDQALRAMKIGGILAVTWNAVATEMKVPFGGYGLAGVCTDSAAILDFAIRGETNLFPLVATGRFLIRAGRRLIHLYENTKEIGSKKYSDDVKRLILAFCRINSDLHASPDALLSSSTRYLAFQPETACFKVQEDGKSIMKNLMDVFEKFDQLAASRSSIKV